MKTKATLAIILFSVCTFSFAQTPSLFSKLQSIKNSSETMLKMKFMEQELEIAAIKDDPSNPKAKEIQRQNNFKANKDIIQKYTALQESVDELITQLKADLTISNKAKLIKKLNHGATAKGTWYYATMEKIQNRYIDFVATYTGKSAAIGIETILSIFTALVDVFTSSRDFRAEKIKLITSQLDGLRLKEFDQIVGGKSETEGSEKEKP